MQDDWKVSKALTVFLGLRYEVVGTWHEEGGMLANFFSTMAVTTSCRARRSRRSCRPV